MRKGKKRGTSWLLGGFVLLAGLSVVAVGRSPVSAKEERAMLMSSDCEKCHVVETQTVAVGGKAHKTAITCQECHEGHRPEKQNNIPECSLCHAGAPHYEVPNCRSCHDPHQPLEITLQGELKDVCVSCHASQGADLVAFPSMHSSVSCNFCHADRHGAIPACGECHASHGPEMTVTDCGTCHDAHMPTVMNYQGEPASNLCASCHGEVNQQLALNASKHRELACASCHMEKHGNVPQCADCHGMPHAPGMHERFPRCGDCHGIAHDLNDGSAERKR